MEYFGHKFLPSTCFRVPLKPLGTILSRCWRGFQGALNQAPMMPKVTSITQLKQLVKYDMRFNMIYIARLA